MAVVTSPKVALFPQDITSHFPFANGPCPAEVALKMGALHFSYVKPCKMPKNDDEP
jgi:hypothetical protein